MKQPQKYTSRFFVKMPLYVQQWLRTKYMPADKRLEPVVIPWAGNEAGEIVYSRLVPNERMQKLTPICFSDEMFNMPLAHVPPEFLDRFPAEDCRPWFCAISIPEPHFFHGRWMGNDRFWQLSGDDAREMNHVLAAEFLDDISNFWEEWQRNFAIAHPGRKPAFWDSLMDFMEMYHIDFDLTDSLYREITRKKHLIKSLKRVK